MRIERIELREVGLALRERFEISSGFKESRRIVLVRITAGGVTGWGECVAGEDPNYSYETTDTAWHILTDFLVPAVLAQDLDEVRSLVDGVQGVRGHLMAKASLEMASWDLEARRRGASLRDLVGGARDRVPVGVSIGLQPTDDALVEKVRGYLDEGYRKIKIKIKPGRDVEMLTVLRREFPDAPFMADANSAFTLDDVAMLKCAHIVKSFPATKIVILSATYNTTNELEQIADKASQGFYESCQDQFNDLKNRHLEIAENLRTDASINEKLDAIFDEAWILLENVIRNKTLR